jgi:hypothetical protein
LTALNEKLWLKNEGVFAEYVDTIGNCLKHPEPELSTIYLAVDCGAANMFQAARMFRYINNRLRHETTARNGKLFYSSNWYPKKYSTCGLFPAENIHLALAYFQCGLKGQGFEILQGLSDAFMNSRYPGCLSHVLVGRGAADLGDLDFSDVTSMYLRLIVEGLFGIRFKLLDQAIEIAPGFPVDWTHAKCSLRDASLDYHRNGNEENFNFYCESQYKKKFKIPLRSTDVESVFLNGELIIYELEAAISSSFIIIETELSGRLHLRINHGTNALPEMPVEVIKGIQGNEFIFEIKNGNIVDWHEESDKLEVFNLSGNRITGKIPEEAGTYTLFLHVTCGEFSTWSPVDLIVEQKEIAIGTDKSIQMPPENFEPLDICKSFNCSLDQLHNLEYMSPRPEGYSIGARLNGRYAWEWNHHGHNKIEIDDSVLRKCGGVFQSSSGIRFSTPESGNNVACASIWDNFPERLNIGLNGKASELAVFMIGSTNSMQSYVVNAKIIVKYKNGTKEEVSLINPDNFDDWLQPALQAENETVYFSNCNHGIVQRIKLEPNLELDEVSVEAVANEIIIGILGISIAR